MTLPPSPAATHLPTSHPSFSPPPAQDDPSLLTLLEPFHHLLHSTSSSSPPASSPTHPHSPTPLDPRDQPSTSDFTLLPPQRTSIINQRTTIRYFSHPSRSALSLPHPIDPQTDADDADEQTRTGRQYDVTLKLDMSSGCGGCVWPAAEVLGSYIAAKQSETNTWSGKHVLELGSGTGLVGLVVARLGLGANVWVTDQIPMLPLMRENVALNQPHLPDPCHVEELNWGDPLPASIPANPDVLLLADCVYRESAFQPLVDTLLALSTPTTEILFCYQRRRKADKRFFQLLKRGFAFEDVEDDEPERVRRYRREGTQLLRVRRKGGKN